MRPARILGASIPLILVVAGAYLRATRLEAREHSRAMARVEREIRVRDISLFTQRVAEDPQSAADRAHLAGLYLQRARDAGEWENFHAAERAARAALALRTDRNGKAYLVLASSLLARHEFTEAYRVAREMVMLAPDEPAYRALLAELQVELGDYDAARASFDSLRPQIRHPAVAPRFARWLELTGRPEAAEALLRTARNDAERRTDLPMEQQAWFTLRLADFLLRNGREREGAAAARAGLTMAPDDGRFRVLLARAAASGGKWRQVIRQVVEAGASADIASLALAGDAASALGDTAGARGWWDRADRRGQDRPEPYNRQWTLFRLEHGVALRETRALLEREIRERKDIYGWDQLALARLLTGDVDGAEQAMAQALRLGTIDATLRCHASIVFGSAGGAAYVPGADAYQAIGRCWSVPASQRTTFTIGCARRV